MAGEQISKRCLGVVRELRVTVGTLKADPRRHDTLCAQLEASVKHSRCAVLIADSHSRYVAANPAALALTGYTRAELLKLGIWDLTQAREEPHVDALWRGFLDSGEQYGDFGLRRKSGRVVTARYVAQTNLLPGLHVSVLTPVSPRPAR